uniref:Uncharacterized protein n=1 Tax=Cyanoderma ruficeps TaxID=181631 RepID=A0A8C3REL5_9PASS
ILPWGTLHMCPETSCSKQEEPGMGHRNEGWLRSHLLPAPQQLQVLRYPHGSSSWSHRKHGDVQARWPSTCIPACDHMGLGGQRGSEIRKQFRKTNK